MVWVDVVCHLPFADQTKSTKYPTKYYLSSWFRFNKQTTTKQINNVTFNTMMHSFFSMSAIILGRRENGKYNTKKVSNRHAI
jgi:hypothetical protein